MEATKYKKNGCRVGDNTRRLIYSMVLIPIVPAAAVCVVHLTQDLFGSTPMDDIRWFNFISATIWVTAIIAIWRKAIVWTLGRRWLTALVGLIPFVQVVYGHALWNSGCMKGPLRASQFQVGVGVWIWVSVWVWWIWERRNMNIVSDCVVIKARRLPEHIVRIVASLGSLPIIFGLFFIAFFAFDELFELTDIPAIASTYILCAILTMTIWIRIWWGAVIWSFSILLKTIFWGLALMVVPILGIYFAGRSNSFFETLSYFSPVIGWGLWMAGTVRYWPMKDGAGGGGMSPKCMSCGYLLTGLRGTRCPECGDEPTLDELWSVMTEAQL